MSDNDPRLRVVRGESSEDFQYDYSTPIDCSMNPVGAAMEVRRLRDEVESLIARDAADRAAGIVRVDVTDEAVVERLARIWYERETVAWTWDKATTESRDGYLDDIRTLFAALREAADE